MAGDWIKMRVWLSRDPRVIRMADYLSEQRQFMDWLTDPVRQSCKETAYEHVTRNVITALCVTGLLVTWGTAREQGDRVDDDLVLSHCDKYTIDSITDIQCFGESMEFVGWLQDDENGKVTFPKFFKDNESPDEKHKRQNAERQARYRLNQASKSNEEVTQQSNVTVTPREEKRREEKNISTTDVVDKARGKSTRFDSRAFLIEHNVKPEVADDWIALRKQKRATPTRTAIDGIRNEAFKACITLNDALAMCCQRGWQGFKAEWVQQGQAQPSAYKTKSEKDKEWLDGLLGKPRQEQVADSLPFIEGEVRRVA